MTLSGRRVYEFSDPFEFLRSEFQAKKQANPEFSVRQWAEQMGLDKPDLLVAVLKGKKPLRPRYLEFLRNGLSLDASEELYFLTLILKRKNKDAEDSVVYDRLLQTLSPGQEVKTKILNDNETFSEWAIHAILSALELPALRSKEALIEKFSSKLSAEEIDAQLEFLEQRQLVTRTDEGYIPNQQRLTTTTDRINKGAHRYYAQVSDLAKQAIPVDLNKREFQCFSLTIDSDDLPAYKEMIRNLRLKMASRALHTINRDSVYQMNMQLFPLVESENENRAPKKAATIA